MNRAYREPANDDERWSAKLLGKVHTLDAGSCEGARILIAPYALETAGLCASCSAELPKVSGAQVRKFQAYEKGRKR